MLTNCLGRENLNDFLQSLQKSLTILGVSNVCEVRLL